MTKTFSTWDEFIGNRSTVDQIIRSLKINRLSHSSLFHGPESIGKRKLAITLAQALNCQSETPCGKCQQCSRIIRGVHADIHILDPDSGSNQHDSSTHIGIDAIKDMQRTVNLKPFEGDAIIIIIDGAEKLSPEAANRLLKTLEEPPPNVHIILLSSDLTRVLQTISSRCFLYQFKALSLETVEQTLTRESGLALDHAHHLASLSEGRIGWAINTAKDESLLVYRTSIIDQVSSLLNMDYYERLQLSGKLAAMLPRKREYVHDWLRYLQQWWRDLLLFKGDQSSIVVNQDRLEQLTSMSQLFDFQEIHMTISMIQKSIGNLNDNANPRLVLDVLMLHLPVQNSGFAEGKPALARSEKG